MSAPTGSRGGLKNKPLPRQLCWNHPASDPKLQRTRFSSASQPAGGFSLRLLPFFSTQIPPRPAPWHETCVAAQGLLSEGRRVQFRARACRLEFAVMRQQGLQELCSRRLTRLLRECWLMRACSRARGNAMQGRHEGANTPAPVSNRDDRHESHLLWGSRM